MSNIGFMANKTTLNNSLSDINEWKSLCRNNKSLTRHLWTILGVI